MASTDGCVACSAMEGATGHEERPPRGTHPWDANETHMCCSVKGRMGDGQDGSWLCRSVSNSAFVMCVDFRVQCDLERDNVERKVTTSIVMARVSDRWPSAYRLTRLRLVPYSSAEVER
jgi:hypothetical protein